MYKRQNKDHKEDWKVTYEVAVHFNENAIETVQDKLKRIMLRETGETKGFEKGRNTCK